MATHNKEYKRLGDGSLPTEDPDQGLGHIVPVALYNKVFISLICLTVLTVLIATVHLGSLNIPVAFAIAALKASLVILFFMHMKYERFFLWLMIITPVVVLFLMIFGTLGDEMTKNAPFPSKAIKFVTQHHH